MADDLMTDWSLRADGQVQQGRHATLQPVRTADGVAAVLKVGHANDAAQAHLVLRRWGGDGAVRLLRADPHRRAVLLERVGTGSLDDVPDDEACEHVARLYGRLHVDAMPQLPSLASLASKWSYEFTALPRNAPIPHRLVSQAVAMCRDLSRESADHVLHGNLHSGNVLAAEREPWLAISPRPLNGDPAFELAPMLWHRWDEHGDAIRWSVQRRLYTLIDAAGLDEDRARAWVVVRIVREAVRGLEDAALVTRLVTLAKAVEE